MSEFTLNEKLWQQGMTLSQYLESMQTNQIELRHRLERIQLSSTEKDSLAKCHLVCHVAVLTEDWCSDSLMNLPILARMVEALPAADLLIFPRPLWEGMNQYFIQRGIRHIPVFWFLDGNFTELGVFEERSKAARERGEQWKIEHPEFDAVRGDPALSKEEKKTMLAPLLAQLKEENSRWYNQEGLQSATVAEILQLLQPY